jgi:signal transduction histidine kinase
MAPTNEDDRRRLARDLHDGPLQTLIATKLTIEICRDLIREGRIGEALRTLGQLDARVEHEYLELRDLVQALASRRKNGNGTGAVADTKVTVRADFTGPIGVVEHVVHILREAVANVRRHSHARSAEITLRGDGSQVAIRIDDDGIGLPDGRLVPRSIASRVHDLDGRVEAMADAPGVHLHTGLRSV